TIAQSGTDEHGAPWPLYFGAFGEFKNPTLIYLLAGCIRLFGPSILAPRLVCALAGWAAALLLGLLARRVVYYYARNLNPHQWLAHGDPTTRHHVPGMGSLLFPTFALAVLGAVLLLRRDRRDPWGRFAIHGFAVSPIPASLAWGAQHTLRLIAIPVF